MIYKQKECGKNEHAKGDLREYKKEKKIHTNCDIHIMPLDDLDRDETAEF